MYDISLEHQPSPSAASVELVERMNQTYPTNIVADTAFGSQEFALLCKTKGHGVVCSVNTGVQDPWLWKWIKWNLSKNEGRVLLNDNGVAASIYCDEGLHCVYTTNILLQQSNTSSSSTSSTPTTFSSLLVPDDDTEPEWWVEEILEVKKKKSNSYKYKTKWSTGETTWETFPSFVDVDRLCTPFVNFAKRENWVQGLSEWSKPRLQELCKAHGFSRTGNREKLINRIAKKFVTMKKTKMETLTDKIQALMELKSINLHKTVSMFYKNGFNNVDIFNNYLSSIQWPHKFMTWQSCFIWNLLDVCCINAWVMCSHNSNLQILLPEFLLQLQNALAI